LKQQRQREAQETHRPLPVLPSPDDLPVWKPMGVRTL
jgi:hypothetical protein